MKNQLMHLFIAATLISGCAAAPVKEVPMDATVTLQPTRTVALGSAATLRFDGVEDSRCPPDVQCITAGQITYKFTLTGDTGTESFALNKDKPAHDVTTVKGARIALGALVEPSARATTASTPPPIYTVTLKITRQ